jgi:hypothetical protein
MKYRIHLRFERTEIVEIEAPNAGEARELVMYGEYENKNVIETHDDSVEIIATEKVK